MTMPGFPIAIYLVEGGGCGGCALEVEAARSPRYGAIRRGIVVVDTPAHADLLLLCGSTPLPMVEEIRHLAQQVHRPWRCLRLGDCALEGEAIFPGREVTVPGCPPRPEEIIEAIVVAWRTRHTAPEVAPRQEEA